MAANYTSLRREAAASLRESKRRCNHVFTFSCWQTDQGLHCGDARSYEWWSTVEDKLNIAHPSRSRSALHCSTWRASNWDAVIEIQFKRTDIPLFIQRSSLVFYGKDG